MDTHNDVGTHSIFSDTWLYKDDLYWYCLPWVRVQWIWAQFLYSWELDISSSCSRARPVLEWWCYANWARGKMCNHLVWQLSWRCSFYI